MNPQTPTPQIDILDSLISIGIILFILSVIVEKITQLIRKYSPFVQSGRTKPRNFFASFWRNIKKQQIGNTELDDKVEREVTSLSIVIGSIVALICRADLFRMISEDDPRKVLFWSDEIQYTACSQKTLLIISITVTGFFLSFGSKFFHDLLDTLLQVKNLKRKLVDDATFNIDSVDQLDEYLNKSYSTIVQTAINQNRSLLQVPNAISPPMHGRIIKNGNLIDCIDLHLSDSNRKQLPTFVQVKLDTGKTVNIPIHVVYDVEIPKVTVDQGNSTANSGISSFKGTICCRLKQDNQEFLLTCSHVVTGGTAENKFGQFLPPIPASINDNPNGQYTWAICTDKFDIALLEPATIAFDYIIQPKKERKPTPVDMLTTNVRVVCRGDIIKTGKVINDSTLDPIEIEYIGGGKHSLANLIVLSNADFNDDEISYSGITIEGDSGACVYDDRGSPIGMIVAGNNKFSYAIPIVDILGRLSATIN